MKLNVQMVASFTWEENKEKNIDEKSLALYIKKGSIFIDNLLKGFQFHESLILDTGI